MTDAVLPQAVLTPAVAVVGAGQDRAAGEALQQRAELLIQPLQTGPLTATAL